MTVGELDDQLHTFERGKRKQLLSALFKMFTPMSIEEIGRFMKEWDRSRPQEEFLAEHNDLVRGCIQMETSVFGNEVRRGKRFRLPDLLRETAIPGTEA